MKEDNDSNGSGDPLIQLDGVMLDLIRDAAASTDVLRVAIVAFGAGRHLNGEYRLEVTGARLVRNDHAANPVNLGSMADGRR